MNETSETFALDHAMVFQPRYRVVAELERSFLDSRKPSFEA
jgi:hypothetical protein